MRIAWNRPCRWLQGMVVCVLLAQCLALTTTGTADGLVVKSARSIASADPPLSITSKKTCQDVHEADDKCAFVQKYCSDDDPGLLHYLDLYYCKMHNVKPVYWVLKVSLIMFLFLAISICASDFLTPNLATFSANLGMSEALAGVTLLALGNGSPDLFSTFTAMSNHSGSLAIGELIGAAGFITTVVAAACGLPGRFRIKRYAFLRDIVFFATAVGFSLYFLIDGHLALWECMVMVLFYVFYVCVCFSWSVIVTRIKKKQARHDRARRHFVASSAREGSREPSPVAMGEFDEAPLRETESEQEALISGTLKDPEDEDIDDTETRDQMLADMADISNQMRVTHRHRRTLSRITSIGQPIRPSLLGALEFGSVLQSLERARTRRSSQSPQGRRHSGDVPQRVVGRSQSGNDAHTLSSNQNSRLHSGSGSAASFIHRLEAGSHRVRSVSANAADILAHRPVNAAAVAGAVHADRPAMLAPPADTGVSDAAARRAHALQLQIPAISISDETGQRSAVTVDDDETTVFSRYTDDSHIGMVASPGTVTPIESHTSWPVPTARRRRERFYALMHRASDILFPQLKGWDEKSYADKTLSVIAVPILFAFTITIPIGMVLNSTPQHGTRPGPVPLPNAGLDSTKDRISSSVPTPEHEDASKDHDTSNSRSHLSSTSVSPLLSPVSEQSPILEVVEQEREEIWDPYLMSAQIMVSPVFFFFIVYKGWLGIESSDSELLIWTSSILASSFLLLILFWYQNVPNEIPAWQSWLSVPGFAIAIGWVSMIADEVVGILQSFQLITGFSEAILGLIVFAAGNSVSDLFANYNTSKAGRPEMAFHACFGGPLMNILVGIGLGGMYHTIKKGRKHTHSGRAPLGTQFHIDVGRTLVVSGLGLLVGLVGLTAALWRNRWVMDKKIGVALIAFWGVVTSMNVVLEILQIKGVIEPW